MSRCYLHEFPGDCWPKIDNAHWVPKRVIKREFVYGAMVNEAGRIVPQRRIEDFALGGEAWRSCPIEAVMWDPRIWSHVCRFHHGQMDNGRLFVPRDFVPVSALEFCDEYGLMWLFDRLYPTEVEIAA